MPTYPHTPAQRGAAPQNQGQAQRRPHQAQASLGQRPLPAFPVTTPKGPLDPSVTRYAASRMGQLPPNVLRDMITDLQERAWPKDYNLCAENLLLAFAYWQNGDNKTAIRQAAAAFGSADAKIFFSRVKATLQQMAGVEGPQVVEVQAHSHAQPQTQARPDQNQSVQASLSEAQRVSAPNWGSLDMGLSGVDTTPGQGYNVVPVQNISDQGAWYSPLDSDPLDIQGILFVDEAAGGNPNPNAPTPRVIQARAQTKAQAQAQRAPQSQISPELLAQHIITAASKTGDLAGALVDAKLLSPFISSLSNSGAGSDSTSGGENQEAGGDSSASHDIVAVGLPSELDTGLFVAPGAFDGPGDPQKTPSSPNDFTSTASTAATAAAARAVTSAGPLGSNWPGLPDNLALQTLDGARPAYTDPSYLESVGLTCANPINYRPQDSLSDIADLGLNAPGSARGNLSQAQAQPKNKTKGDGAGASVKKGRSAAQEVQARARFMTKASRQGVIALRQAGHSWEAILAGLS